jgi:hypothetical protein
VVPADPFVELLDAARAEAVAASRARERWLRRQAEEEATVAGTLVDLAEQGVPVALRTGAGRPTTATVVAVGRDFCAVRTPAGRNGCLALGAITRVRPVGGRVVTATGDRRPPLDLALGELLARAVGDRPAVRLLVAGDDDALAGELRAVSAELVTLALDGDTRAPCFVPLTAVAEVWFVAG